MPQHLLSLLLLVLAACPLQDAPLPASALPLQRQLGPEPRPRGRAFVSGYDSDAIHVFETATGRSLGTVTPVPGAQSIVVAPDGALVACAEKIDQVLRIDPASLTVLGALVADDPGTPLDEAGGLDGPTGAVFGPDGNLYVASFETDEVLRFEGTSGAFLGVFVTAGSGGLNGPDAGLAFGPDGDLYVPSFYTHQVLRYDGATGVPLGAFASSSPGNLFQPRAIVFRGTEAFVASSLNNRVLRYDLAGNFLGRFCNGNRPYGIAFHPDDGDLYMVSLGLNLVRRHDGQSGSWREDMIPAGAGGLLGATYLLFTIP